MPAFVRRVLSLMVLLLLPAAAAAAPVGVMVRNESTSATCAETDNVSLKLVAEQIEKFTIIARHPAYVGMLRVDNTEPDFETCDMSRDPVVPAPAPPPAAAGAPPAAPATGVPRRVTIFETPDLWITGFTFPSFWRAASVPVRIGGEVTQGLHMLQLWVRQNDKAEEVLVVYPPDGYWRARPLSPTHLRSTAYGSSFLVGPVEQAERPLVRLKELDFAPQTRTFTLHFADGGKARLQLAKVDGDQIRLEVQFDGIAPRTFAALRSMYVTEGNADVARVAWRTLASPGTPAAMGEAPVMSFTDAQNVSMLWAGRLVPSRHNTSAPDFTFEGFAGR
ncbi:hypothetical protein ABLE93_21095 [Xanthobacter sp. KR7-65]|uniref:hypothetical protein n=1 Tax=Xanthobacter sp. KR7-65 TaxID=3156612 RepID=UPI0032B5773F